jgi:hypothetical protein
MRISVVPPNGADILRYLLHTAKPCTISKAQPAQVVVRARRTMYIYALPQCITRKIVRLNEIDFPSPRCVHRDFESCTLCLGGEAWSRFSLVKRDNFWVITDNVTVVRKRRDCLYVSVSCELTHVRRARAYQITPSRDFRILVWFITPANEECAKNKVLNTSEERECRSSAGCTQRQPTVSKGG